VRAGHPQRVAAVTLGQPEMARAIHLFCMPDEHDGDDGDADNDRLGAPAGLLDHRARAACGQRDDDVPPACQERANAVTRQERPEMVV
jgi:hypothetical protein